MVPFLELRDQQQEQPVKKSSLSLAARNKVINRSGSNYVKEIEPTNIVFWGKILCYKCWERGINKKKVKELQEQLWKYLEPYGNELKKDLTLRQLEEIKKIFEDNYFGESDDRSKEIFNALVRIDEYTSYGPIPLYKCLKKIEQEIERLKRASEPQQQEKNIYINCPFCNKEFSCEVEKTDPTEKREAKEELNEKMTTHIREVHGESTDPNEGEVENKPSVNQKSEQTNQSSASSNKSKISLPLIIIGSLLVSILLIGCFLLFKKHKSKK